MQRPQIRRYWSRLSIVRCDSENTPRARRNCRVAMIVLGMPNIGLTQDAQSWRQAPHLCVMAGKAPMSIVPVEFKESPRPVMLMVAELGVAPAAPTMP